MVGGAPGGVAPDSDAAVDLDMWILLDLTGKLHDFPLTVAPFGTPVNVAFIAFTGSWGSRSRSAGVRQGQFPLPVGRTLVLCTPT